MKRNLIHLGVFVFGLASCKSLTESGPPTEIRYIGSSTVAIFLRDAERVYPAARFQIDSCPESEGGERAIALGTTDLAGTAKSPSPATRSAGAVATLIGRDAIAVIVNDQIPLKGLTTAQLRAVFTGKVTNWKELAGPDLPLQPFIVGADSATRAVFQSMVLPDDLYAGCEEVTPDRDIIRAVAGSPGAVGQISFAFLEDGTGVHTLAIDGETPSVTNFDYPIARPLYLLWREGNAAVEAFVKWTQSDDGQRAVMQHFVGVRVVGSVEAESEVTKTGTLVVYTETYPVQDGGIYYYPHRPYEILTRYGKVVRRVPNHRGENDEEPMRVQLPPGVYLIRPETSRGGRHDFFVTIEPGKVSKLSIEDELGNE